MRKRISYEDYKDGYEDFVNERVDYFDDYVDDVHNGKIRSKHNDSMFDIIDNLNTIPLFYV